MTTRIKRLLVVAAVVVAVTVVVVVSVIGGFVLDDRKERNASKYCADMPDAIGLYDSNPVTQMGYKVGKVVSVVPQGDHVRVMFELNGDRKYPADVKAVTRSKSLLADRSLELVGNYTGGPALSSSCVPLDHSYTPKSISEIAGSAADFIDELAPDNEKDSVAQILTTLNSSLEGQGPSADAMLRYAAGASANPDALVSDIGSSIRDMSQLSARALQEWPMLRSLMDQMPDVVEKVIDLFPGVINVVKNVGWVVPVLYDIQTNYGGDIWPVVNGPLVDVIHLAATRSDDISSLISSIPAVAGVMRQQTGASGELFVRYDSPELAGTGRAAMRKLCSVVSGDSVGTCATGEQPKDLLGLLLMAEGGAR